MGREQEQDEHHLLRILAWSYLEQCTCTDRTLLSHECPIHHQAAHVLNPVIVRERRIHRAPR